MKNLISKLYLAQIASVLSSIAAAILASHFLGVSMSRKHLVIGLAVIALQGFLIAGESNGGFSDERALADQSQERFAKLVVELIKKKRVNKTFRATKLVVNIARREIVGGAFLVNMVDGSEVVCPLANFSATSDIEAVIKRDSIDSINTLNSLNKEKRSRVIYKIEGGPDEGILTAMIVDEKSHPVSLNSRDIKTGISVRMASFDRKGNVTGYIRYFGLEVLPKSPFSCNNKTKFFRDYRYENENLSLENLDMILRRLLDPNGASGNGVAGIKR